MGYGANLVVTNNRPTTITTYVNSVQCMYQDGDSGSHLEYFNNLAVQPNSSYPSSGNVYIEAKNSGTCFFQSADFTIKVCDSTNAIIGSVSFSDSTASWKLSDNTNTDLINVNINNGSSPGHITITVAAS
jgi:hypothetical protein